MSISRCGRCIAKAATRPFAVYARPAIVGPLLLVPVQVQGWSGMSVPAPALLACSCSVTKQSLLARQTGAAT